MKTSTPDATKNRAGGMPARRNTIFRIALLMLLAVAAPAPARAESGAIKFDPFKTPLAENSYQQIGARLSDALGSMDWGDGTLAILVQDADYPLTALGKNETQPLEPGAVLQLVTAAAALDDLGPEFRFTTTLGIGGAVNDHELNGSVVVRGDGDPTMSARGLEDPEDVYATFDRWAKLLRKQGIRRVTGGVAGDDRAFDTQRHGAGWALERLGAAELPSVGALNFNDNCVDIFWKKTKKAGALAQYDVFPKLPQYVFIANLVKTDAVAERGRQYTRERDSNVISMAGLLPLRGEAHDRAAIEDPGKFFAEALKLRLIEKGIAIEGASGPANKISPAGAPAEVRELDSQASPPLHTILAEMLRRDLALHAEVVFKAMGRQASGRPGGFENGQEAVRAWVDRQHLPGTTWPFADGSGRSRMDRISPAQLLAVMRAARRGPYGTVFGGLLPRAGEPGVLAERLRPPEEPGAKKTRKQKIEPPPVWAVSGSAVGVETLAGYAETRFQRRLAFAVMVGGSRLPAAVLRQQIDTLVLELTR